MNSILLELGFFVHALYIYPVLKWQPLVPGRYLGYLCSIFFKTPRETLLFYYISYIYSNHVPISNADGKVFFFQ